MPTLAYIFASFCTEDGVGSACIGAWTKGDSNSFALADTDKHCPSPMASCSLEKSSAAFCTWAGR